MKDNDIDGPYNPPLARVTETPTPPLKTDKTLRKWLVFLLVYPAFDIGFPVIALLLMGQKLASISMLIWPLVSVLLIGAAVLIWKARSKLILLAFPPIIIGLGFTSAMTMVSLVAAFFALVVLFFRLPKALAGT
jgi:hypothetical protein